MIKFYKVFLLVFCLSVLSLSRTIAQSKLNAGDEIKLSYINPREYEIADIKVTGVKTLNENALISISGLKTGDRIRIPGEATGSAIKNLWENGIIGNVSIAVTKVQGDKIWLSIELTELPRLSRIEFKGINETQKKDLNENLVLIRGRVVSDAMIRNVELNVRNYFIDKGFLNTEVTIIKKSDTLISNSIKLVIDVDKKKKVKIKRINLRGNEVFSDGELMSKMKGTNEKLRFHIFREAFRLITNLTPKKTFDFLTKSHEIEMEEVKESWRDNVNINFFKSAKFDPDKYKADKKALIAFYHSKGYRDAEILSDSVYNISEREMGIDIKINEGKKYYFRDIIWTGNFIYSDEQLDRILGVRKGDVYNMDLVWRKINYNPHGIDLKGLYMDDGYLFFQVDPVEIQVQGDSIDVEMRLHEGEQATINKVIVKGNDRTYDNVIYRELRTLPGQKFSRSNLIRTQRELSQLGYFDPEQMGIQPIPNPADGTVDIEYSLVEQQNDQISLSGGWGGDYLGFIGTLGFTLTNFSVRDVPRFNKWRPLPVGDGQSLSLSVKANGKQYQNYSMIFTEPWLGGKQPNSFTIGVNRSVQRRLDSYTLDDEGKMTLTSLSLGLGKRIKWPDDYFTINNSLSYSLYELDDFSSSRLQLGFSSGVAHDLSYNFKIARNSIDQPYFPRSGSQISLGLKLTPPYSLFNDLDYDNASIKEKFKWVEYHKWMFDASFYKQLVGDLVINARAHFGSIDTYSKKAPAGPFDRFQLGGDGLPGNGLILGSDVIGLRGYDNNAVTPPFYGLTPTTDEIIGGVAYNKYVMELRYPISLKPQSTIYVLGFAEAGNSFYDLKDYNPFSNYTSAGVGVRIRMPAFGLLGIDWGYGFDKLPGRGEASGGQFHFTIGKKLR